MTRDDLVLLTRRICHTVVVVSWLISVCMSVVVRRICEVGCVGVVGNYTDCVCVCVCVCVSVCHSLLLFKRRLSSTSLSGFFPFFYSPLALLGMCSSLDQK